MAIEIYFTDGNKRPEGFRLEEFLRRGTREALTDMGQRILDIYPQGDDPGAAVYRVIVERVEREKPDASA